jgi:hypothetical protein
MRKLFWQMNMTLNGFPDDVKLAFSNSMYKCFVFDHSVLIGAGRALAGYVDCSYLSGRGG